MASCAGPEPKAFHPRRARRSVRRPTPIESPAERFRPLDRVSPVIFLDAIVCKVRTDGVVRHKGAHLAGGADVDIDGRN